MPTNPQAEAYAPGWAYGTEGARKACYFPAGSMSSLCGKVAFFRGDRDDAHHDSADNCAKCKKLRAGLAANPPVKILIPEPSPEVEAVRKYAEQASYAERFREVVWKHLAALADDLSGFEQTTHGVIVAGPVAEALGAAMDRPNSYTISTLSQTIRLHLRGRKS